LADSAAGPATLPPPDEGRRRPGITSSVAPSTSRFSLPTLPALELNFSGLSAGVGSSTELVIASIAVLAGIFSIVVAAAVAFLGTPSMPMADTWDYWRTTSEFAREPLKFLFSQHNEHRIAALRLFLLADHHWFRASGTWLMVCNLIFLLATSVVICRLAVVRIRLTLSHTLFLFGILLCVLFSAQQFDNLTWTFQIGFLLAFTGGVWSFACLFAASRATTPVRAYLWMAAVVLFGAAATYSLASGLLIWLVLIPLGIFLGLSRLRVAFLMCLAVFFFTTYMSGYVRPPHHADPADSITQFFKVFGFAVTYIGSPVDELFHNTMLLFAVGTEQYRVLFSAVAGCAGLSIGGWYAVDTLSKRKTPQRGGEIVLLHVLLFITGSAFLTALGRINFSTSAALVTRYATPALIYWACLAALYITGDRFADPLQGARRRWVMLSIVLLVFVTGQLPRARYARDVRAGSADATSSMLAGVYDDAAWSGVYHSPRYLFRPLLEMRTHGLGPFGEPQLVATGRPAATLFDVPDPLPGSKKALRLAEEQKIIDQLSNPGPSQPLVSETEDEIDTVTSAAPPLKPWDREGRCYGHVDAVGGTQSSLMSGHFVQGWAWDIQGKRVPKAIVVIDEQGIVRGYGKTAISRGDVRSAEPEIRSEFVGYKVYVPGNHGERLWAFGLLGGRSACLLGNSMAGEIYTSWPLEKVGKAVAAINARTQGAFRRDTEGLPPRPAWLKAVFSSAGPASTTGVLEFAAFEARGLTGIGLPLVTGAKTDRLSVEVRDVETGAILCSLRPPAPLQTWSVWRIDLPAIDGLKVAITVRDQGDSPDEFIAVGVPRRPL